MRKLKADKYIALHTDLSRRKAYDLIGERQVKVNGKVATYSTHVDKGDMVEVNGNLVKERKLERKIIAYNKPKGIVCTGEKVKDNLIDALKFPEKLYIIGRLDKDSEGLILLTNDAALVDKIANPANEHEKEYLVTLNLPVREAFLREIREGTDIGGGESTAPCVVKREPGTKRIFRIILKEGMNRQIRRMCNKFDYQVLKLQRVRVMHIELGKIKTGEWRQLDEEEMSLIP